MKFKSASIALATAGLMYFSQTQLNALSLSSPENAPSGELGGVISLTNPKDLGTLLQNSRFSSVMQKMIDSTTMNDPSVRQTFAEMEAFLKSMGDDVTFATMYGSVIKGMDVYIGVEPEKAEQTVLMVVQVASEDQALKIANQLNENSNKTNAEKGLPASLDIDVAGTMFKYDRMNETYFGQKGNKLFMASGGNAFLTSSLQSSGTAAVDSLENLAFLEGKVAQGGDLAIYLNFNKLVQTTTGQALQQASPGQVLVNIDFDGTTVKSNYFFKPTEITDARKALIQIAPSPQQQVSSFLPSNAIAAYSTNILEPSVLSQAYDLAKNSPESAGQFGMIEMMAQQTGLSIKEDLIPAFGPMVSVSLGKPDPTMPLPIPSITIATKIADQERANLVITKIEEGLIYQATESAKQMNPNAPAAEVIQNDFNGTPIRSVSFTTPFVKLLVSHSLTSDGHYLLSFGNGGIESALTAHSGSNSLVSSSGWDSMSPEFFQTNNHLAIIDAASASALLRQVLNLTAGFTGSTPEQLAQANMGFDLLETLGTLYNANRNDPDGTHGYTMLKLQ
ncbi:MAG: hypothetical protein ACFCU1_07180 [Sumerlaeia bacterium]